MDYYVDDVVVVVECFGVCGVIYVGYFIGGGEVVYYIVCYFDDLVLKVVIISVVLLLMVKIEGNLGGLLKSVFDDF